MTDWKLWGDIGLGNPLNPEASAPMIGRTDAEKVALVWLAGQIGAEIVGGPPSTMTLRHLRTIQAMLAEPRLPKEPVRACFPRTERYTMPEWDAVEDAIKGYHRTLHAHLAAPKTKTVWRVTAGGQQYGPDCDTRANALEQAHAALRDGSYLVSVSGPHEVPA